MSFPLIATAMKTAFSTIGAYGSAITAALSVGQTVIAHQEANAQADAVEAANRQADNRARRYMIEDYDAMTRMEQQETAAASQKINENQIEATQAAASARVAASAGGVSGLSVDALLGDIFGQEASIRDSVNQNLEATGQQINAERVSLQRGFTDAINTRPQPQRPSTFGTALTAATGIVGAYKDQWKIRGGTYDA